MPSRRRGVSSASTCFSTIAALSEVTGFSSSGYVLGTRWTGPAVFGSAERNWRFRAAASLSLPQEALGFLGLPRLRWLGRHRRCSLSSAKSLSASRRSVRHQLYKQGNTGPAPISTKKESHFCWITVALWDLLNEGCECCTLKSH